MRASHLDVSEHHELRQRVPSPSNTNNYRMLTGVREGRLGLTVHAARGWDEEVNES
jgi:hypothetical protein